MRIFLLAVPTVMLISGCGNDPKKSTDEIAASVATDSVESSNLATDAPSKVAIIEQEKAVIPTLTPPQLNATRSAEQYLNMSGFSRKGLIEQLSSDAGDGYSVTDATVAVDSLSVDWNENAAKSARQYLNMTGFSCKGLIEQLSSSAGDNYSVAQATYGARQAGAC